MTRRYPRTIAYLRVSTSDQEVDKNKADILLLGPPAANAGKFTVRLLA